DIGDSAQLRGVLDELGLDGAAMIEKTREQAVKDALRASTDDAIARGVFGVPTYFVEGELFWGNDRLDDALAKLRGQDPLDPAAIASLIEALPAGAQRKR